jgi:hypothetical protein
MDHRVPVFDCRIVIFKQPRSGCESPTIIASYACGTVSDRIPGQLQRFHVLDGSRSTRNWENAPGTPVRGLFPAAKMATLYRRDYVQNSNDG